MNKNWNPFLNLVIELKKEYKKKLKKDFDYNPEDVRINKTCVNKWVNELNDEKFINMFSGITLWQYKDYVIAHYNDYYKALNEKGELVNYKDFFDLYNRLYMECRGVVVDVRNETLALVPFRKFFNLNEREETSLENIKNRISKASCIEFTDKLDGSMISAGYVNNEIVVAGSSCNHPDRSPIVKDSCEYIENNKDYLKMLKENINKTFIFEYIFPKKDLHIVQYTNTGLYLTGIRENLTGKEYSYHDVLEYAEKYHVASTKEFQTDLQHVLSHLDDKKSNEAEGFVVNIDGYKIKIKYNDYVEMNRMVYSAASINYIIKAIEHGTIDDVIAKAPEGYKVTIQKNVNDIYDMINKIDQTVENYYNLVKDLNRKEAMIKINTEFPKKYRGFITEKYNQRSYSYLKSFSGHYRKYEELENLLP